MFTEELVTNAPVQIGEVVAERYEVTEHLGTGGFAKVFRGHDRVIERDVAIKFLDLRSMGASGAMLGTVLERFQREAKLAARIPHRDVVQIYDIGKVEGDDFRPFIVMELLSGHDLEDQFVEHGPMEPARLIPLFISCLDALGQAHEQDIVHKDLKPSNLFLSSPGTRSEALRIVDFGIAHLQGKPDTEDPSGGRLTATGQILGTLQYLSPEYIADQVVTPALDVYQMGLILTEMLSGKRLIESDNPFECLRIHTFGLLEIPQYLLDSPLGPVLQQALHPDHELRYASAGAFADALSAVDVATVPPSPMIAGGEVAMARFQDASSSPGLRAPTTGQLRNPTTEEISTQGGAALGLADTRDMTAPERVDPVGRASAGAGATAHQAAPGDDNKKLGVLAAVLGVGILASVGILAVLLSSMGGEGEAPKPPEVTQTTSTKPATKQNTLALNARSDTSGGSGRAASATTGKGGAVKKDSGAKPETTIAKPPVRKSKPPVRSRKVEVLVEGSDPTIYLMDGGKKLKLPRTMTFRKGSKPRAFSAKGFGLATRRVRIGPKSGPRYLVSLDPQRKKASAGAKKPVAKKESGDILSKEASRALRNIKRDSVKSGQNIGKEARRVLKGLDL